MNRLIHIDKKDHTKQAAVVQVRKDSDTTVLNLVINRCNDGVDLSGLEWEIAVVRPDGTIVRKNTEARITDSSILIDWRIDGECTDIAGDAKFELIGGKGNMAWLSGIYRFVVQEQL